MPNPTLPVDVGLPTPLWANDLNNWRAEDATWLLARSNLRFNNTADWFGAPTFGRGAVAFLDGTEELVVGSGPGSASYVIHGKNLKRSDDGLLHRSSGSSVMFSATDVTINPELKIVSPGGTARYTGAALSLNSDALVISTTTTNSTVVSTKPVVITASNVHITNTLTVGGSVNVAGTITAAQPITAPEFIGKVTSTTIETPTAKFGNFDFAASVFKNYVGPVTLDFAGQSTEVRANKLTLKVPPGGVVIDDGSTAQGQVAAVVVKTTPPVNGTDNYPLGTLWVVV
jgi:hypothetical protein